MNRLQRHLEWSIRRAQRTALLAAARDGLTPEQLAALEFEPDLPALTAPQLASIDALSDENLAEE